MTIISKSEVKNRIASLVANVDPDDFEEDNEGQVIIHTGVYRWKDGSYNTSEENEVDNVSNG